MFDEPIVEFVHDGQQQPDDCAYSVVIGNNGSGKSRLLGNIAGEFVRFHRGASGRGGRSRKIRVLDYAVDGRPSVNAFEDVWAPRPSVDLFPELPSRLIAVALTVVDKFPLEPSGSSDDVLERNLLSDGEDPQFYCYVGMRDRTNRASISALIYRALDGLDRARSGQDNERLSQVFDLLGYAPEIQVKLGLGITPDVAEFARGERDLEKVSDTDTRLLIPVGNFRWGVYAFFDYDGEPIYVGQTNERLRTRIRRHLTKPSFGSRTVISNLRPK